MFFAGCLFASENSPFVYVNSNCVFTNISYKQLQWENCVESDASKLIKLVNKWNIRAASGGSSQCKYVQCNAIQYNTSLMRSLSYKWWPPKRMTRQLVYRYSTVKETKEKIKKKYICI